MLCLMVFVFFKQETAYVMRISDRGSDVCSSDLISIAVSRLPPQQREKARKFGIAVACLTRIALLLTLAYLAHMKQDLFTVFGQGVSIRDLVLILGGVF